MKNNVNERIKASHVLLIDEDGSNLGKVSTDDALRKAKDLGLDLVEMSNDGPVCKIMDYGKWKYQSAKKAKKNTHSKKTTKEISFRPNTSENDLRYRAKQAGKFLKARNKVKLVVKFKGREQAHAYETGRNILEKFLELVEVGYEIKDTAKSDGRTISLILNPSE